MVMSLAWSQRVVAPEKYGDGSASVKVSHSHYSLSLNLILGWFGEDKKKLSGVFIAITLGHSNWAWALADLNLCA